MASYYRESLVWRGKFPCLCTAEFVALKYTPSHDLCAVRKSYFLTRIKALETDTYVLYRETYVLPVTKQMRYSENIVKADKNMKHFHSSENLLRSSGHCMHNAHALICIDSYHTYCALCK